MKTLNCLYMVEVDNQLFGRSPNEVADKRRQISILVLNELYQRARCLLERSDRQIAAVTILSFVETCKLKKKNVLDLFKGFFDMVVGGRTDYEQMTHALLCVNEK